MKNLWESYRDHLRPPPSYEIEPQDTQAKVITSFDLIAEDLQQFAHRPRSADEFEDYYSEEPYDIKGKPVIYWWAEESQRKRWPRLLLMAINILSIKAMSDEPERVFSGGRRTISWERAKLEAETIEIREC